MPPEDRQRLQEDCYRDGGDRRSCAAYTTPKAFRKRHWSFATEGILQHTGQAAAGAHWEHHRAQHESARVARNPLETEKASPEASKPPASLCLPYRDKSTATTLSGSGD